MQIVEDVKAWFAERDLTDAVVGFSGGVDSAATIALLVAAGIKVHAIIISAPDQTFSSEPKQYIKWLAGIGVRVCTHPILKYPTDRAAFNEAWLPVARVAILDGYTAELRTQDVGAILVGTVNFSEGAFSFFGLRSDAACDFYPISHLTKYEVWQLAADLDVPPEIITATPSGDLQFSNTNDAKMIGASYAQIEDIITVCDQVNAILHLEDVFNKVDNIQLFTKNIIKNSFKYVHKFPGFHLSNRLEHYRKFQYQYVLGRALRIQNA